MSRSFRPIGQISLQHPILNYYGESNAIEGPDSIASISSELPEKENKFSYSKQKKKKKKDGLSISELFKEKLSQLQGSKGVKKVTQISLLSDEVNNLATELVDLLELMEEYYLPAAKLFQRFKSSRLYKLFGDPFACYFFSNEELDSMEQFLEYHDKMEDLLTKLDSLSKKKLDSALFKISEIADSQSHLHDKNFLKEIENNLDSLKSKYLFQLKASDKLVKSIKKLLARGRNKNLLNELSENIHESIDYVEKTRTKLKDAPKKAIEHIQLQIDAFDRSLCKEKNALPSLNSHIENLYQEKSTQLKNEIKQHSKGFKKRLHSLKIALEGSEILDKHIKKHNPSTLSNEEIDKLHSLNQSDLPLTDHVDQLLRPSQLKEVFSSCKEIGQKTKALLSKKKEINLINAKKLGETIQHKITHLKTCIQTVKNDNTDLQKYVPRLKDEIQQSIKESETVLAELIHLKKELKD